MATSPAFPLAKWAYSGTDDTIGVEQFPFSSGNSLPALVVWLILSTNPSLANTLASDPAGQQKTIAQISGAVNLTTGCVTAILKQFVSGTKSGTSAADVSDAFATIGESFHSIGAPNDYPPDECPYLIDILALANSLNGFTPSAVSASVSKNLKP
jgi:hypothetical protein